MGIQHSACTFIKHSCWNTNSCISIWSFNWFLAIASIMTQFWQASIICKGRWWIWVWKIFTCHLTRRCIWLNCSSSGTMWLFKNVFLWSSGMYINQSGCAVTGKQRVVCRGLHQCHICPALYVSVSDKILVHSTKESSEWLPLLFLLNSFTERIVIN